MSSNTAVDLGLGLVFRRAARKAQAVQSSFGMEIDGAMVRVVAPHTQATWRRRSVKGSEWLIFSG